MTTPAHVVDVPLSEGRDYRIHIGAGALDRAGERFAEVARSRRAVVLADRSVAGFWGGALRRSLVAAGFQTDLLPFAAGEARKQMATVTRLYQRLYALPGIDRKTLVVALGGGVVGDIAGFIAATYLRGLDYVQVPTTLLAMVDSSVGGKTGVDLRAGKNLIGAFHQPRAVVIDPQTLSTLPVAESRSGAAEIVKYGVIRDPDLLAAIARDGAALWEDPARLSDAIARSCAIKAQVVAEDEREETGLRAILNYGHTIGHALEGATGYRRYRHGEAVAIGMVSAACIGEAAGVTPGDVRPALVAALRAVGLPTALPEDVDDAALLALAGRDKKAVGGDPRFVLAHRLGDVALATVPESVARHGLRRHRQEFGGVSA